MKHKEKAILILSDMEGVSGIIDRRLAYSGEPFWKNYGRYLLTEEINVIARTVYSMGIKRVYLSESHNMGKNTVMENLLPFITVLPPHSAQTNMHGENFWEQLYKEKNIKGAIMVGCHAMAGVNGFLPHSWDSNIFEYIKVNKEEVGESGLMAGLLGYYNIPLISVIGDETAAKEAVKIIPEIIGVTVKKSEKGNWLNMLVPDAAHELISKKICKAIKSISKIKVFTFKEPAKLSFRVKKEEYLTNIKKDKRLRIEKQIVHIEASNYKEAYKIFWDCYLKMILG